MTSKAEWDQLAARLDAEADYRVLRRVPDVSRYADGDGVPPRLGLIVEVETTGLEPDRHKIIEFAILPFHFSPAGNIYDVLPGYAGFEDPKEPIPPEVVDLTGITDEEALIPEREFLCDKIYAGDPQFQESKIDYSNRFSDRI